MIIEITENKLRNLFNRIYNLGKNDVSECYWSRDREQIIAKFNKINEKSTKRVYNTI